VCSKGQGVLLCFEPAAALLGLSLLHLTILPDSNQDGTRPEPEQLLQLIFMLKNAEHISIRHTPPHLHNIFVNMTLT
jgi:hypothetical protein